MSLILSSVLAASVAFTCQDPVAQEPAHAGWSTDWDAAKAQAKKEGKDLLIDFTGSDWCIWCKRLKAEVFDQEAFQGQAPESFVLVELDFPNDKSGQSEELQAQNQKLMEQFGVEGFPSIFLADEEGRPYAQTGYQQGGAEPYLEHLAELAMVRSQRDKLVADAMKAEGAAKAQLLSDAVETMKPELHKHYMGWIEEIIVLDADGKGGLKEKYEQKKRSMQLAGKINEVKGAMNTAAQAGDWAAAGKALDEFFAAHEADLDPPNKHELYYYRGVIASRGGDDKKAIEAFQNAMKSVPDHPMNERIVQIIEELKKGGEDK
jgi:thioredoxin-related protein